MLIIHVISKVSAGGFLGLEVALQKFCTLLAVNKPTDYTGIAQSATIPFHKQINSKAYEMSVLSASQYSSH